MVGKLQSLHLDGLEVHEGDLHADDIRTQLQAKLEGRTWAAPVSAKLTLKDNATGRVVDSKKIRIAEIPLTTSRYSHIVDGQEYQVTNQWQLKPGIYARRRQTGELEAHFNIPNKSSFEITFNPATKQFRMERGGSKAIPVYPIMKSMGVDDDTLEHSWGKEILDANKAARGVTTGVEHFFRADRKRPAASKKEAEEYLHQTLTESRVRPEAVQLTLGKPLSNVTGEALHLATAKLLKIQAGHPEDDRDSLVFKDLRTTGDFAHDKLANWQTVNSIRAKFSRKINLAKNIRDVVKFDTFNEPIRHTFTKNSAAATPDQVNPVEMITSARQTTVMGPGGIQSEQSISDEAKFINPSHLGFLDPLHTPENEKTGVTLHLPIGVQKVGNEPRIPLYNLKTGKLEHVGPSQFIQSRVVLPDQLTWKGGKPIPISPTVKMSGLGNELAEGKFSDAHYAMIHPSQLFDVTSNLIPFLGTTSGNRATYATHHIQQAISLLHREAPLVQSATGSGKPGLSTFEEFLGRHSSHVSPIDGTVSTVKKDAIIIQGADGKKHEIQLYNNFPLNDPKSFLHSTPLVKVGDKITKNQTVADTNFTKNGVLSLGTNLRVAYLPFKGYNFEDGVVLSDSAAKKLSSVHMHKPSITIDEKTVTSPKKFMMEHPESFHKDQYKKLDENGVIKVGEKVTTGDPLIIATRPYQIRDRMGIAAIRRSLSGQHTDVSLRWDSDHSGEVVGVHKRGNDTIVHVRTTEPMQIGDKLAGRYGNKGIVTMVLPDKSMPHTKDGKHIEVALNPSGVPGRMNVGQMLETAAAKVAEKTGKTYVTKNFDGADQLTQVEEDLKKHGISDMEELHDPETGTPLGKALVGPQYMLKLMHQIDKKISVRAGMGLPGSGHEPEHYDLNLMPSSGAKTGAQSIGSLGLYTLLAHGAKANIREMQTFKSEGTDPRTHPGKRWESQHIDVWNAIQTGSPLPTPRPTFAFHKFTEMLKASGINIEKKGHNLHLSPMTDKQILRLSSGELPKPSDLTYAKVDEDGEPKPKPGGLFDPKLTGGHGGKKWTHVTLAEPVPNPIFENAIQKILGFSREDYRSIVDGEKAISSTGQIVPLGTASSSTGGSGIKRLLDKVDVRKDLNATRKELEGLSIPKGFAFGASTQKIDKLTKKVKYLQALDRLDMHPSDAYILHHIPILPPVMRPASVLPDGTIRWADLNGLYSQFAQVNGQLKDPLISKNLTDEAKKNLRRDLYDGVKAISGYGTPYEQAEQKGVLLQIAGSPPKRGYFQKTLMNRRQDLTMRSVIVPEPALGLDEVGLPAEKAMTLFRPFVVKKLQDMGAASGPLEAQEMLNKNHPTTKRALELVAEEQPILLKRDPALHKHSVLAFKPKLVAGRAIQIHPLVTSGFNADFDGDTMSVYVPVSKEAVGEARKMFPSNNLFSEATGHVMYQPTLESALGLYKLSRIGSSTSQKFSAPVDALKAAQLGKIQVNDVIDVGGTKTTAGRILIASTLPKPLQNDILTNHSQLIDKKGLTILFSKLAKEHSDEFPEVANRLKDLGNGASYGAIAIPHPDLKGPDAIKAAENAKTAIQYISLPTHSLGLKDMRPDKQTRDRILDHTQKQVDEINKNTLLSKSDKERRAVALWGQAADKMQQEHQKKERKDPSNLFLMQEAGVKPSWDQYKQMVLAPVLVSDASGKVIPTPIKKSYSEGLDLGSYWTQMHGARHGNVLKVQQVQEPGYFSKKLINTAMNMVVADHDCGTHNGIALPAGSPDVYDRYLARDFGAKGVSFKADTLLTPDIVSQIRSLDKDAQVLVRSPLKCEHPKGICQKDAGLSADGKPYPLGTNLGILAAQSLGERSVQLTLKAFHSGGVVSSGGSKLLKGFARIDQLMKMPEKIPDSSVLAMRSGNVDKIEEDPTGVKVWINGQPHHVGKDRQGVALHVHLPDAHKEEGFIPWTPPKVGMHIEAGTSLSDPNRTAINPHHLYQATGSIEKVQNYLVNELHDAYSREGVRRQHVEALIKSISNLTRVRDPGDADGIIKGEFHPTSVIKALNSQLVKQNKKPVEHSPVLVGVDMMPLEVQEDWMAKLQHNRLRETLVEAASTGAVSNIHGLHPIPGAAYGAEFGLTEQHSKQPGLAHLKSVPQYAY